MANGNNIAAGVVLTGVGVGVAAFLIRRGLFKKKKEPVEPGVPQKPVRWDIGNLVVS